MSGATSNNALIFGPNARTAFLKFVHENPSNRRVSSADRETIIDWLTNSSRQPSSQQEFSRRNYVQKAFMLKENMQTLWAPGKTSEDKPRKVVTVDLIADVVESVHKQNDHLGWDRTWRDVSEVYYGIMRCDVIFLLKKCQVCAHNPSKRPKSSFRSDLDPPNFNLDVS